MFHMNVYWEEKLVSRVDFDYTKNYIHLENFTDKILFRPFGVRETIDFKALEEFFRERVWPPERPNINNLLRQLGLQHYDPFAIVLKTHAVMAGDYMWVKFDDNDPFSFKDVKDLVHIGGEAY